MHTCLPPLIVGLAIGGPRMDLTGMVALLGRAGRRRQALCNGASPTIPRLRHRLSFAEAGPATVRSPTGWGAPALNNFFWRRLCRVEELGTLVAARRSEKATFLPTLVTRYGGPLT